MARESPRRDRLLAHLVQRVRMWIGEPASPRRVLVRNGAWESASFAVYAAAMFFLSPFIVHRLGNSLYGIWEIVISLTGFLGFADLGVRPAAVHFVARYDARRDIGALNGFVNTSVVTFAAGGALVLLAAGPLAFLLPRFWRIAPGFENEAAVALLIVAGGMALSLPFNAFSAVLVGKQRYDRLGQIRLVVLGIKTVSIVVVLSQGWGLIALAIVVAATGLLEMLAFTVAAFLLEPSLVFSPRLANRNAARRLLGFGGWAMAVIVALQVTWATDALVIGRAVSDTAVAFFAIGFKLAFYARELLRVAARVVEPATGALHGLGDQEGIRRLLTKSVRVMLLIAGPILIYLLTVGKPFLRQWMGPEYARLSAHVLVIMTLAILPAIASAPLAAIHYGSNRVRPLALLMALEAALNLGLSILLVGPWGIEGVAIGTAVPAFLVHAVLLPLFLCRHYGIRWSTFLVDAWAGPVLASILPLFLLHQLVDADASHGWVGLIGLALLSAVLYGAAALLVRVLAPRLMGCGPSSAPPRAGKDES